MARHGSAPPEIETDSDYDTDFEEIDLFTRLAFLGVAVKEKTMRRLNGKRYTPVSRSRRTSKSLYWYDRFLPSLPEKYGMSYDRINDSTFNDLKQLLQDHALHIFVKSGPGRPQMPLDHQLHIGLYRMGHEGNAAGVLKVSQNFKVSTGTVKSCTARVLIALNIQALCISLGLRGKSESSWTSLRRNVLGFKIALAASTIQRYLFTKRQD